MRISKEQFEKIAGYIRPVLESFDIEKHRAFLVQEGKSKDINMRIRWDVFWAASDRSKGEMSRYVADNIYAEGMHDDHIDTALKKIVGV